MDYLLEEMTKDLKTGEKIVSTHTKAKIDKTPPYITVGNGLTTKDFPENVAKDAFKVFRALTKEQQGLFIDLKDIYIQQNMSNFQKRRRVDNPNNVVLEKNKENDLHQSIKKRMGQRCNGTELEAKGVLKKLKPGNYMLNPYIFIPPYDFKKVAAIWDEL